MKILVLTPVWGRPGIVQMFLRAFERYNTGDIELRLVPILSPEDQFFQRFLYMFKGYDYYIYKNRPLGEKKNEGLRYSFRFDWDYLLEMGSDNILNNQVWDIYRDHWGEDMFGFLNLHIYDIYSKEMVELMDWNDDMCFGAGRMIRRDICEDCFPLWDWELNDSLDTMSRKKILACGYNETAIWNDDPMVLDMKSNTQISPFEFLKNWGERVDKLQYFDFMDIDEMNKEISTPKGFQDAYEKYRKEFATDNVPNHKIYEMVEMDYERLFGGRMYKNYNSFRSCRNAQS